MSSLRPTGVPVNFDGVNRRFLFTFEIIDELQYRYPDMNIFRQMDLAMQDTVDGLVMLIHMVDVMCPDVGIDKIPQLLKVNMTTGEGSLPQIRAALQLALMESMPVPDEDDRSGDGDGKIEISKFLIISMDKFAMTEAEAWKLTLRKFALLNEAYMYIHGMKKAKEETMSLLDLP